MQLAFRVVTVAGLLLASATSVSAFDRRMGARSLGMGDAFAAMVDDPNVLNYNPAGLAFREAAGFSLEYANLYYGLDDGSLQENHVVYCANIFPNQGIGLAWNNRSLADVYTENEFILGFAAQPIPAVPLWAGLSLKMFYLGYTDSHLGMNPYFDRGREKYQFGLDAGILFNVLEETEGLPGIRAGVSLVDLNQPDLGLRSEARQPLELRAAVAGIYQDWDTDLELVMAFGQVQFHAGVEKWFSNKAWGLRAGVISGAQTATACTVGGSYSFDLSPVRLRLNYAFNYSLGGIQDTIGIHRLSLDVPWPAAAPEKTRSAGSPAMSEKMARLKSYLMSRIDAYLVLSQKVETMRAANTPQENESLTPVVALLHDAVGELVLSQDIIAFLRKLEAAETMFQSLGSPFKGAP